MVCGVLLGVVCCVSTACQLPCSMLPAGPAIVGTGVSGVHQDQFGVSPNVTHFEFTLDAGRSRSRP